MFTKKQIAFFCILFLPMLILSALLNFVFSLNVHDYIEVNWFIVAILAVILDTLFTWTQTRKENEK